MNELDAIRERQEHWESYSGESRFRSIAGTVAAKNLILEDLPKLLAALDAVLDNAERWSDFGYDREITKVIREALL